MVCRRGMPKLYRLTIVSTANSGELSLTTELFPRSLLTLGGLAGCVFINFGDSWLDKLCKGLLLPWLPRIELLPTEALMF